MEGARRERASGAPQKTEERVPLSEITNDVSVRHGNRSHFPQKREELGCLWHVEYQIGDLSNPQDIVEYENVVYRAMRHRETRFPHYDVLQAEISAYDRAILVDWLCRVHYKCQLTTNTFYVAIGILDRVISTVQVPYDSLELVGCTCMLIASKQEDVSPINVESLVFLTENAFPNHSLLEMEDKILSIVDFDTTFPTPLFFLTLFLRLCGGTRVLMLLSRYILEVTATSDVFIGMKPSIVASTALSLARIILNMSPWTEELANFTQYSQDDLQELILTLHSLLVDQNRLESRYIRKKYSSSTFNRVATISLPPNITF